MSELITQEMEIPEDNILDFTTTRISGWLNFIMISTKEIVDLRIELQHIPEMCIYESLQVVGNQYLPIRTRPINEKGESYTHGSFVRLKFNDSLRFIVKGEKGIRFKAVIDWEEASA